MPAPIKLPTLLYIGAPKCASTWMFRTLQAHPQVFVPPAKDIFYFDRQYHRDLNWYASFFASADTRHRHIGELSTSYLYSEAAANRIRETLPAVKLMACVRNPIARCWSAFLFKKRNAMATNFEAALAGDPTIREWGLYSTHLARYRNLFGDEQFKIFVYDDLQRDPEGFRESLYQFLDLDPDMEPPLAARKVLPASRPRLPAAAAFAKRGARLARRFGFANLVGRVKSSSIISSVLYTPLNDGTEEAMPPHVADQLAEYYADDIARVSELLGRDLSHWVKQASRTQRSRASGSESRS